MPRQDEKSIYSTALEFIIEICVGEIKENCFVTLNGVLASINIFQSGTPGPPAKVSSLVYYYCNTTICIILECYS